MSQRGNHWVKLSSLVTIPLFKGIRSPYPTHARTCVDVIEKQTYALALVQKLER